MFNSVNSFNSYSAVLPPSPMVFFNWYALKKVRLHSKSHQKKFQVSEFPKGLARSFLGRTLKLFEAVTLKICVQLLGLNLAGSISALYCLFSSRQISANALKVYGQLAMDCKWIAQETKINNS